MKKPEKQDHPIYLEHDLRNSGNKTLTEENWQITSMDVNTENSPMISKRYLGYLIREHKEFELMSLNKKWDQITIGSLIQRGREIFMANSYAHIKYENIRMAYGHPHSHSCGGLEGPFGPAAGGVENRDRGKKGRRRRRKTLS